MYPLKTEKDSPQPELSEAEESKTPEVVPDIFEELTKRKRKGLYSGDVDHIEIKEHNLTSGKHFYEFESIQNRTIVCTTCPVRHGGILEAKHLLDYELKAGVLYFKGKACNETP